MEGKLTTVLHASWQGISQKQMTMREPAAAGAPLDGGEVDDHVGDEEADHAEHAAAGAHQRQAGVLEGRAEEVACSGKMY